MNVANRVTYLSQKFIFEIVQLPEGRPNIGGQFPIRSFVLVQAPGDLIQVAADLSVLGGQLPDGGKQLVIDRGDFDNGMDGQPADRPPDKLGLADPVKGKLLEKVRVLVLGHAGLYHTGAVRHIVGFLQRRSPPFCPGWGGTAGLGEGTPQQDSLGDKNAGGRILAPW